MGRFHLVPVRIRLRCWTRTAAWLALGMAGCAPLSYTPEPLPTFYGDETIVSPPRLDPALTGKESKSAVVTLPTAVRECIVSNLRVRAGSEKVQQAQADFTTEALIPNSTLFVDGQLLPLTRVNSDRQAGPPQFDAMLTVPIDWWLFGKRIAAMEAASFQVDVAAADLADLVRQRVRDTVLAFYDLLEARELARLAKEEVDDILRIEEITKKQVDAGGAGTIELDRVRLAVLDARRELRKREAAIATAKSKLRPFLGRSAGDSDFEIEGTLDVTGAGAPPTLAQAIELAEANRPDLLSDRRSISQAMASVDRERLKSKPQMSLQPGLSYQHQKAITGFPNALLFDVGVQTTLPISDRNQGNIAKAESSLRASQLSLQADLVDIKAEIEQALTEYRTSLAAITAEDPATLEAAKKLREKIEAAYNAGGRRLLELLDAHRAYRDRVRAGVSSKADYWRALNRLNAAVGLRAVEPGETVRPMTKPDR